MNSKKIFCLLVLSIIGLGITSCSSSSTPKEAGAGTKSSISASGAFAIYPLMVRWAEEYQKINPNVQIDVSAGGAGKGMSDALSGMVDIGMVSREVKPEETSQGAFDIAISKDAVFPTVNEKNPLIKDLMQTGISKGILTGIYIEGSITTWGGAVGRVDNTDTINAYTRSDACGAAEVWAKFTGNKKQEDLKGIGVSGDPGIVDAVKKDVLGIGFNNLNYAFDASTNKPVAGIIVIPIDFNGNGKADDAEVLDTKEKAVKAVADGSYPEPPARLLHLVTKGKPNGAVRDFIVWILNDGQKLLGEVGYIAIPEDMLTAQKGKLQ